MPRVPSLGNFRRPFSDRRSGNKLECSSSSVFFWVSKLSSQAYQWQIPWWWLGQSRKTCLPGILASCLGYIFSVVGRKAQGVNLDSSPLVPSCRKWFPGGCSGTHDFEEGDTWVDSFPCCLPFAGGSPLTSSKFGVLQVASGLQPFVLYCRFGLPDFPLDID